MGLSWRKHSVSIGANCHGNYIYGLISGTISDSNTYNPIMDYNGSRFYFAPQYTTGILGAPSVNASSQATAYRINSTTVMAGDGTSLYLLPQVTSGNVYVGGGGSAFYVDQYGMLHTNGTSPTASAGSVTGTNTGGYVSSLTAANLVTLTFANSGYSTWASCVGNTSTNSTVYGTGNKTSWTFTFSPAVTGSLNYHCDGR